MASAASSATNGLGLFALRVSTGAMMLFFHGMPHLMNARSAALVLPDPLHIGRRATIILILVSQVVGSIMLMLGLATRLAALLGIFITAVFMVKWNAPTLRASELPLLYIFSFLVLLQMGGGSYSLDKKLS